MTTEHDGLHAFADGELSPDEAARFRDHLATCAACASELHELMMLEAVGEPPRAARSRAPAVVHSLEAARHKRMRRILALAALVPVAAAAAFLIHAQLAPSPPRPEVASLALEVEATRSFEPRLAYGPADRHRTYDVARAAGARAHEQVPLATLAALESRGDEHGLAAGLALSGDTARAAEAIGKAGTSVDVQSDRAALLLAQGGHAAEALAILDAVLAVRPGHPQALFNRGLALRDLGQPRAAAQAFERAAAAGEPGWSDEARARARALGTE
jgi:tetratricopeptide (TPR) repeat protein